MLAKLKNPPEFLALGDYKFIKVLAAGGQGIVCQYQKVETGEMCAVKFDPNDSGDSDVLKECNFFRAHHNNEALTCIPKYYEHGKHEGRRYLII